MTDEIHARQIDQAKINLCYLIITKPLDEITEYEQQLHRLLQQDHAILKWLLDEEAGAQLQVNHVPSP